MVNAVRYSLAAVLLSAAGLWYAANDPATVPRQIAPVAIVSVRSLDRLMEVLRRMASESGSAEPLPLLEKGEAVRALPGLDPTQPVAVFAYVHPDRPGQPEILMSIPVRDMAQLETACQSLPGLKLEPAGENRWKVKSPARDFIADYADARLHVATNPKLLSQRPGALALLQEVPGDLDVSVRLEFQAVPETLRAKALENVDRGLDRELLNKRKDAFEQQARVAAIEFLRQTLHHIVDGTQRLECGVRLEGGLHGRARWTAMPESALALEIAELQLPEATWRKDAVPPALSARVAVSLPARVRASMESMLAAFRGKALAELGAKFAVDDRHPVMGVFDSLQATLAQNCLSGVFEFVATPEKYMAFVASIRCEQPERIADTLGTVLPHIAKSKEIRAVDFGVIPGGDLIVHRLSRRETKAREQRLYGPDPAILVGTGPHEFLFALGGPATDNLLSNTQPNTESRPPLLELDASLQEWLDLARLNHPDAPLLQRLEQAFPEDSSKDKVHFRLRVVESGLEGTFDADPVFAQLLRITLLKR